MLDLATILTSHLETTAQLASHSSLHFGNIDLRPFDDRYAIAFYAGKYPIRWYAILSVIGYLLAIITYLLILKFKYKLNPELGFYYVFVAMPMILFGARFWSCLMGNSHWDQFFDFWDGGMAIQGGVIFGAITGIVYFNLVTTYSRLSWKKVVQDGHVYLKKTSVWIYADAIIPTIMLGQAVGRWGNYFNGGLFGQEVSSQDLAWLHTLMPTVYEHMFSQQTNVQTGLYAGHLYEPLFLYSSFFLVLCFISIQIFGVTRWAKTGTLAALYFVLYGILRFVLESQRNIAFHYVGTYILNGILMVFGVLLLLYIIFFGQKWRNVYFWRSLQEYHHAKRLWAQQHSNQSNSLTSYSKPNESIRLSCPPKFIWLARPIDKIRYTYRF